MLSIGAEEDCLHDGCQVLWFTVPEDVETTEIRHHQENVGKDELCHEVVLTRDVDSDWPAH